MLPPRSTATTNMPRYSWFQTFAVFWMLELPRRKHTTCLDITARRLSIKLQPFTIWRETLGYSAEDTRYFPQPVRKESFLEVMKEKKLSSPCGTQSPFLSQCRRLFAIPNELYQLTTIANLHLHEWKLCTLTTHTHTHTHTHTQNTSSLRKDLLWFHAWNRGLPSSQWRNWQHSACLFPNPTSATGHNIFDLLPHSPRTFKVTRMYRQWAHFACASF